MNPLHDSSERYEAFAQARPSVPEFLPEDGDPIWRLARAERELVLVHAAEQARWLRFLALLSARRQSWGGATEIVPRPRIRDWRSRLAADLVFVRRGGLPIASSLEACSTRPLRAWPRPVELASEAEELASGTAGRIARAVVALASAEVDSAQRLASSALLGEARLHMRSQAFGILGLLAFARADLGAALLHLRAARSGTQHAGPRVALELVARSARGSWPLVDEGPCSALRRGLARFVAQVGTGGPR
jgi:hypothetical protein